MRRNRAVTLLLILASLAAVSSRCGSGGGGGGNTFTATVNGANGKFTFEGEKVENAAAFSTEKVKITFELTNARCPCTEVTFIQVLRIVKGDGTSAFPHDGQRARATADGWALDRVTGSKSPFYPLNNDGTYNPIWDTPGSNTKPAVLRDVPGWNQKSKFEFVTCAICRRGECANKTIKCLYWTFSINADGTISDVDARAPTAGEKAKFGEAVDKWNTQTAGSGGAQEPVPALSDL